MPDRLLVLAAQGESALRAPFTRLAGMPNLSQNRDGSRQSLAKPRADSCHGLVVNLEAGSRSNGASCSLDSLSCRIARTSLHRISFFQSAFLSCFGRVLGFARGKTREDRRYGLLAGLLCSRTSGQVSPSSAGTFVTACLRMASASLHGASERPSWSVKARRRCIDSCQPVMAS